jgi:hypothetical protein
LQLGDKGSESGRPHVRARLTSAHAGLDSSGREGAVRRLRHVSTRHPRKQLRDRVRLPLPTPRGVPTPRRFSSAAMARRPEAPAACSSFASSGLSGALARHRNEADRGCVETPPPSLDPIRCRGARFLTGLAFVIRRHAPPLASLQEKFNFFGFGFRLVGQRQAIIREIIVDRNHRAPPCCRSFAQTRDR